MKNLKPLLFLLFLNLSACAIGPLVGHETARTVGDGKTELVAGYGNPGTVLKLNRGISENFDLGVQVESLSMGVRGKYAFINANQGWSLAGALGYGFSFQGQYTSEDLTTSYLNDSWEPYGTLRFSQVTIGETEIENANTHEHIYTVKSSSFQYGQVILGTRYWINDRWMLSGELIRPFVIGSDIDIDGALFSIGFGYRN